MLFFATMYLGPCNNQRTTNIPWFIGQWVNTTDEDTLGMSKLGIINLTDELFESKVLHYVMPYFACMKPMLRALRAAIKDRTIDHRIVIDSLKTLIKDLPPETPKHTVKVTSNKTPIDRILEHPDFKETLPVQPFQSQMRIQKAQTLAKRKKRTMRRMLKPIASQTLRFKHTYW